MAVETLKETRPGGIHVTSQLVFNLNGVQAVGQTTGTVYRIVGVTSTGFRFAFGTAGTADVGTFVQTWQLVPLSGGRPLSFQEVLNVIFNPHGNLATIVSAQKFPFRLGDRGSSCFGDGWFGARGRRFATACFSTRSNDSSAAPAATALVRLSHRP